MTETYHQKMTTNARMVSKVLTRKRNTFYALRELIDNSINAGAKHIKIDFIPTEGSTTELQYHPIDKIIVEDDGVGVPFNEFNKCIMELATDHRQEGYGVGRFSALQIGKVMNIETVGYDKSLNKYTTTNVTFNVSDFTGQLENKEFDVFSSISDEKLNTGFKVEISQLYENEGDCDRRNRLTTNFREESFPLSIFEVYHKHFFKDSVKFLHNGHVLEKEEFIIGEPHSFIRDYKDLRGDNYQVKFLIYTLKVQVEKGVRIFLENSISGNSIARFKYNSVWIAPEQESQFVIVSSENINDDLKDRYDITSGEDKEWKNFADFLKTEIEKYYKDSNAKFKSFIDTLKKDKSYPFTEKEIEENGLQVQLFNNSLFMLNNDQDILNMKDKSRTTFYNMFRKSLDDGNVGYLIKHVLGLTKESREKMMELIDDVNLDEVIRFSSALVKRKRVIEDLYQATIAHVNENVDVWEDGSLKCTLDQNFWIFGEEYEGLNMSLVDTDLENAIKSSIEEKLVYKPRPKDENLIDNLKPKVKKIDDLFFIKERLLNGSSREIIIVFIKSPSTKIYKKEAVSLQTFLMDIQKNPLFPYNNYHYVVMYLGSQIDDLARTLLYQEADNQDNHAVKNTSNGRTDLKAFVYEWRDLIEQNKRKMEFMHDSLKLNDINTLSSFIQEYGASYQPSSRGRLTVER